VLDGLVAGVGRRENIQRVGEHGLAEPVRLIRRRLGDLRR